MTWLIVLDAPQNQMLLKNITTFVRLSHCRQVGRYMAFMNERTYGPVNAHLISWPSKAQNIQNLENIW